MNCADSLEYSVTWQVHIIDPQSNGLDERFNQTLQRQLLKFVDSEQKKNWDQYLDVILFHIVFLFKVQPNIPPFFWCTADILICPLNSI